MCNPLATASALHLMAGIGSYFTGPSASKRRITCYWEAALEADHAPASPVLEETDAHRKVKGPILRHIVPQNQDNILWEHGGQSQSVSDLTVMMCDACVLVKHTVIVRVSNCQLNQKQAQ
jgi:hypothetical protein